MTSSACCTTQSKALRVRAATVSLLVLWALSRALVAQSPITANDLPAADTLQHLSLLNSLDAPGMKPWHLKVSYQTFTELNKPEASGVAEEWWAAPDQSRLQISQGDQTYTEVTGPESHFYGETSFTPGVALRVMLAQIVHPVGALDLAGAVPEVRSQTFGKAKLLCTMLTQPSKGLRDAPLGLYTTFCADDDRLRISWLATNIEVITNQAGTFQGHDVPIKVDVFEAGVKRLEAHLDALGTVPLSAVDLSTTGLHQGPATPPTLSGGVIAGNKIGGPQPVYPVTARQNRVSGTVVVYAVIGKDGRVHTPRIVSSPDTDLSLAALIAVSQWVYRPYLLNGAPTDVTTQLTIHFNMNHL